METVSLGFAVILSCALPCTTPVQPSVNMHEATHRQPVHPAGRGEVTRSISSIILFHRQSFLIAHSLNTSANT